MIKNGKVFGKINLIDFLFLLILIVAVAAAAVFILRPKKDAETLVMKFRIEEVDNFVAEKVHVGDALYDDTYEQDIGEVTDVETAESISFYGSSSGADSTYAVTSRENYCSMIITGEVKGRKTKLGAEIGGKKYGVGHSMVLRAGDAKLYLRVYDIAVKGEEDKSDASVGEAGTVKVVFYTPEVEDFTAAAVKVGDDVARANRVGVSIGKVVDAKVAEAVAYSEGSDGVVAGPKEGYVSLELVCDVTGEATSHGVVIDGKTYSIGEQVILRAGNARLDTVIKAIG